MPFTRELSEVFGSFGDGILEGVRKCAVGLVTAVNGGFVDVQLSTNAPIFDEFGTATFEPALILGGVPLCVMRGGGFAVSLPVAKGDSVLVVFTDLSADSWRASDGSGPVNPGWLGRHTADSPFAIPCVAPDALAVAPTAGKLVVGAIGGNAITITASDIELGGAGDFVALASKVSSELSKIANTIASLTAGATAVTAGIPYVQGSVASAVVKSA